MSIETRPSNWGYVQDIRRLLFRTMKTKVSHDPNIGAPRRTSVEFRDSYKIVNILPEVVCVLDKKGFVHHTNAAFDALLQISYNDRECPFVGRFFASTACIGSLRKELEHVGTSKVQCSSRLSLVWVDSRGVTISALSDLTWLLCGKSDTEPVLLIGRKLETIGTTIDSRDTPGDLMDDSTIKLEKYKAARSNKSSISNRPGLKSELSMSVRQTWGNFDTRVSARVSAQSRGIATEEAKVV